MLAQEGLKELYQNLHKETSSQTLLYIRCAQPSATTITSSSNFHVLQLQVQVQVYILSSNLKLNWQYWRYNKAKHNKLLLVLLAATTLTVLALLLHLKLMSTLLDTPITYEGCMSLLSYCKLEIGCCSFSSSPLLTVTAERRQDPHGSGWVHILILKTRTKEVTHRLVLLISSALWSWWSDHTLTTIYSTQ